MDSTSAFDNAFLGLIFALGIGWAIYKFLHPNKTSETSTEVGRKWAAWTSWFITGTTLSSAINGAKDGYITWIISVIFFPIVAFIIGKLVGWFMFLDKRPILESVERIGNSVTQKTTNQSSRSNTETKLMELKSLHEKGLINDEEYSSKRKHLLDAM